MIIENKTINKLSFEILNISIFSGMLGNKKTLEIAVKKSVGIIKKIMRFIYKLLCLACLMVPKMEIRHTNNKE